MKRVTIEIEGEKAVGTLIERLDEAGFGYDADFTALHAAGWRLAGVILMGERIREQLAVVVQHGEG